MLWARRLDIMSEGCSVREDSPKGLPDGILKTFCTVIKWVWYHALCLSSAKASLLHVGMTKNFRICRRTDLSQRHGVCRHFPRPFQIDHIHKWARTHVRCRSLCPRDVPKVFRCGGLRRMEVVMPPFPPKSSFQSIDNALHSSTPQQVRSRRKGVIHVHQRHWPSRKQFLCCTAPRFSQICLFHMYPICELDVDLYLTRPILWSVLSSWSSPVSTTALHILYLS